MQRANDKAIAEVPIEPHSPHELSFKALWEAGAKDWARGLAARFHLAEACEIRGLDGLLNVRAVSTVMAGMSLAYSQTVNARNPDIGDGYDQWHAILASTADVFLTGDGRLAEHLTRVPTDGFRVFRSVPELLAAM